MLSCNAAGVEVFPHKCTHAFRIIDSLSVPIYDPTWGADEELLLLEAVDMYGPHSWDKISEHVGIKRAAECQRHYLAVYWEHDQAPLPVALPSMKDVDPTQGVVTAVVAQGGDIEPSSATRGTKSIMEDSEAEPEATTAARGPKGKKRSHPDEGEAPVQQ